MIASNTAEISNTAGFISSIAKCEYPFINDPDYSLRCCFEDNSNEGISNLLSDSTTLEKKIVTNKTYLLFIAISFWELFAEGEYQRSQLKSLISRYINLLIFLLIQKYLFLNAGQCLCNGMTIDDESKPGSCCTANQRHPDHCLCSGTDIGPVFVF